MLLTQFSWLQIGSRDSSSFRPAHMTSSDSLRKSVNTVFWMHLPNSMDCLFGNSILLTLISFFLLLLWPADPSYYEKHCWNPKAQNTDSHTTLWVTKDPCLSFLGLLERWSERSLRILSAIRSASTFPCSSTHWNSLSGRHLDIFFLHSCCRLSFLSDEQDFNVGDQERSGHHVSKQFMRSIV